MKFKNIFFITLLLLTLFSISLVSAEDSDNVLSQDISDDSGVLLANESSAQASSIVSSDLTKYYKNDSQYYATFYDNDGNPLNNKTVHITINNGYYERNTNATGGIKFSINLNPGEYLLNATNPVTNETVFNNITVLSTLSGDNIEKYYRNGTQYYVSALDGQGKALANANITMNINGVIYTRQTNASGVAKLSINLNAGNYTITSTHPNGEKYSNNITVLSTISGANIQKYYRNGTQFYANITDGAGSPIANKNVSMNINGVFYTRETNENGTVRLNINLDAGTYILTLTNPETKEQKSNNITVLSKVQVQNAQSGGNITLEYNNNATYTVKLYNDDGSAAANKNVTFNINGVFYTRTSDVNGTASLTINLRPSNYTITADYNGSKVSNIIKVRVTPDITIINTTVKSNDYVKFRLTEHVSGNPVTGNHYGIVNYNETNYGAYPDSTGLVQIRVGLPAGNYLFYFGMIDDGYYSAKFIMNTIRVV